MPVRPTSVLKNLKSDSTAKLKKTWQLFSLGPRTPEVFKNHCYVHLTFQRCRRHREPLGPRVDEQEVVDVLISSTGPVTV